MKKKFIKTPLVGVYVHGAKDVGTRTVNLLMGEHAGEYVRGDIMDANAVIQAFDELKGNVDTDHDTLEELVNEIHANTDGINEEKTRAQNKEKEISDKLAIVDGDSNTEGSFRKAIADVIAAAPEDLDTLKEIADKLAGNDDLHQAIEEAISTKATTTALNEEITRAKAAEEENKTDIVEEANRAKEAERIITSNVDNKADATALTALEEKVNANTAAIDTKQPKGNYLTQHQSLEEYAKKVELPTVPTKVSQLENDSKFITRSEIPESSNNFGCSFFSDCSNYGNFIQLDSELYTKVTIRNLHAETFDLTIGSASISFSPTDLEKVIYFDPGTDEVSIHSSIGYTYIAIKVEYVAENSSIA